MGRHENEMKCVKRCTVGKSRRSTTRICHQHVPKCGDITVAKGQSDVTIKISLFGQFFKHRKGVECVVAVECN